MTTAHSPKRKKAIIVLAIVGVLIIGAIVLGQLTQSKDRAIIKNGVEATAISTGESREVRVGGRRGQSVNKAVYTFKVDDRNYTVYGEKDFESTADITKGKSVTIKYMKDNPYEAVVVSGE